MSGTAGISGVQAGEEVNRTFWYRKSDRKSLHAAIGRYRRVILRGDCENVPLGLLALCYLLIKTKRGAASMVLRKS